MPMPKGYKKKTGYGSAKSLGGKSYHDIAKQMNEKSYKMNHSTARNLFVSESLNPKQLKDIAIDPRFQEAVADYMREIEDEKQIQIIDK